jgi:hypothetical protein
MLEIISITGPIYVAIALGFLTTRLGLFAKQDMRVLGSFVVNLALPALLFSAISQRQVREIFNVSYLLIYATGSLLTLGIAYCWSRRTGHCGKAESAIVAMGMSCSNSGYVGYPILLLTLPRVAAVAVALNMMVENLLMLPLLFVLADREIHAHLPLKAMMIASVSRLARNPMILAMVAGTFVSFAGWRLPEILTRTTALFAASSGAVSLFVVGGVLVGNSLHGMVRSAVPITAGKLFLHPLAVFGAAFLACRIGLPALDPKLLSAAILMAAMPMLGIYTILAHRYGQETKSAAALLLATMVSFFSLSGLLWLLKVSGWL